MEPRNIFFLELFLTTSLCNPLISAVVLGSKLKIELRDEIWLIKELNVDGIYLKIWVIFQTCCFNNYLVQVILFEIDCAIFYTNLHELLSVYKLNKLGKFW